MTREPVRDLQPATVRALYVHVPFCRKRCGYCDFYKELYTASAAEPVLEAVLTELQRGRQRWPLEIETIFVGGGTPTILPGPALARLLAACRSVAPRVAEFTVEANPATVTDETARILAAAGVDRVSLGAQSFAQAELHVLERTHRPEQVGQTLEVCRRAGISRLSVDLIFGIPGQTLESWKSSLDAALALGPEHLSCYGLTYETGTRLTAQREAGTVTPMDPDLEADLYELASEHLGAAGYAQYEISNYARPGAECRHNLVYWRNEPYLGIGPSAAGYVDGLRYRNVADNAAYVKLVQVGEDPHIDSERLPPARAARETAMLALRLCEGLRRAPFAERFGCDPVDFFAPAIEKHAGDGLVEVTPAAVRLTSRGRMLANRVIADFL